MATAAKEEEDGRGCEAVVAKEEADVVFAQPFRPRMIMTKMTAKITSRRTIAMRTATMGNSLMGLLVAKSVVVAANCFSAGCNQDKYITEP